MSIKQVAERILGKRISGLVVKRHKAKGSPRFQVFLIFSDDTYYEFYTTDCDIHSVGGVDRGGLDAVRKYLGGAMNIVFDVSLDEHGNVVRQD